MDAPFCPISRPQVPAVRGPTLLPVIPIATDLPSLIRAVNIIRDILRSLTTSLTVNNTYLPRQPRDPPIPPNKTYVMSPYPEWYQINVDVVQGFVYYKSKTGTDREQRAFIHRINAVEYRNTQRDDDKSFYWRYSKKFDSDLGKQGPPFKEDFFERVVNVHWRRKLYLYVRIRDSNSRFGSGLSPVARTTKPTVNVTLGTGTQQLDTYRPPDLNGSFNGFNGCLTYMPNQQIVVDWTPSTSVPAPWMDPVFGPAGWSAQEAWEIVTHDHPPIAWISLAPAIEHSSCARGDETFTQASEDMWGAQERHEEWTAYLTTVPVNYGSQEYEFVEYLYAIPAGDSVVSISVGGILPDHRDGSVAEGGYVNIHAAVFSTARESISNLSQILSDKDDGYIDFEDMLLDPDHSRDLVIASSEGNLNVSNVKINIKQDKNPDHLQTSNYGEPYSPYKVIFEPASTSKGKIPDQPPVRIPAPATA